MPAPLLIDLSHTSHTRARTGIQRVVRELYAAVGQQAIGVTFDPHQNTWRTLQDWEHNNLTAVAPAAKRGAQWPFSARMRGRVRRALGRPILLPGATGGLLVPELFSPAVATALPKLFTATSGPRIAVFHDAIALKLPEASPTKTVARFPAYLRELLVFDGVAAVSDDSRDTLLEYWHWLGIASPPPVRTIPLGIEIRSPRSHGPDQHTRTSAVPTVLSIGSIEGRKNHVALLQACEQLWSSGERFELRLIGLAQAETGQPALERIQRLQAAGRPLRYDGPADDETVDAAYAACTFTVYPSIMEGFGLPVLESLAHGKPCICSRCGALGESARGGGCVTLDSVDTPALATAIRRLLSNTADRDRLTAEARARKFKTWNDYAAEVTEWMRTISRRPDDFR